MQAFPGNTGNVQLLIERMSRSVRRALPQYFADDITPGISNIGNCNTHIKNLAIGVSPES